jgi:4-amino-4-deoxy-L-arabinose transferase-like glycosyltransferase
MAAWLGNALGAQRPMTAPDVAVRRVAWLADAGALAVLAAVALVLYLTAPRSGDFWWSDVPRHALNGVFVRDLIADLPLSDPVGYAIQYYIRYPALTILFYPPLFYLFSAPFFALFGVSHAVALVPVLVGYLGFGCGAYAVYRRWMSRAPALVGALMLMGAPIATLWGRQVMLELPCYALLMWCVWFLLRAADGRDARALYIGAFLFVCALYTKQTVAFMVVPFAGLLVLQRGRAVLRDRHVWIAAALFAVCLVPLALLAWKFGQANLQSVAGVDDSLVSRGTLAAWLWYPRGLPEQLGWPTVALVGVGAVGAALRRSWRLPARDGWFLALWIVTGYLVFSAIDLKDLRFTIFILFPVVALAVVPLERFAALAARRRRSAALVVAAGLAVVAWSLARHPVPWIAGYREAVDVVANQAPAGSTILFSGYRDGSFIFDLRARADRHDLRVLRADKLLLKFAVRRELGVEEKTYSEDEIADLMNRYGVRYVVAQSDFWTDLTEMRRLQAVLRSSRFEAVARVPVTGNVPHPERELVIYRNRGPVAPPGAAIQLDLPIIGRSIEGKVR